MKKYINKSLLAQHLMKIYVQFSGGFLKKFGIKTLSLQFQRQRSNFEIGEAH